MNIRFAFVSTVLSLCILASPTFGLNGPFVVSDNSPTAEQILGNSDYPAFSYGGYRKTSRDQGPSVAELKEDMKILSAMGIKLLRTYNTQQFPHAKYLLEAIRQLREEDSSFEMYVMLGAWIDCKDAWTGSPNHDLESEANNRAEIEAAVRLAKAYPGSVKVIAVGNESMVRWAASYFVQPKVILKWVTHLQELKKTGKLDAKVWITSSDNFASWGGGDPSYQTEDLKKLVRAVDFVSMHTYPFHDSHYNSDYWVNPAELTSQSAQAQADAAVARGVNYAKSQFEQTKKFIHSVAPGKPIHIGETGWASSDNRLYGAEGSKAADEYKQKRYYDGMRKWSMDNGLSCFFFEAFDEPWKDAENEGGSENHFGLINIKGEAKFALWSAVDQGTFKGLMRGGKPIGKSFGGSQQQLLASLLTPPSRGGGGAGDSAMVNSDRKTGDPVTENKYSVLYADMEIAKGMSSNPSAPVKVNVWEGTCGMTKNANDELMVNPGRGAWWGCALEIQTDGKGENLEQFQNGWIHFEIKGLHRSKFAIGFQTGQYAAGTQTNNFIEFGPNSSRKLTADWQTYKVKVSELNKGAKLKDVTSLLFFRGENAGDTNEIVVRKVYYSKD